VGVVILGSPVALATARAVAEEDLMMARPSVTGLRSEVRRCLEARRDVEYHASLARLIGPATAAIGVRVPVIRELVKDFGAEHRELTVDHAVQLLDELSTNQVREEFLFGVFYLARFRHKLTRAIWPGVDRWADRVDNWETCDQLAMQLAGTVVSGDLSLAGDLIVWAGSQNPWRRRLAAAATTVLNHGGQAHVPQTLAVCEVLMQDGNPVVLSAVAWAIREASRKDQDAAARFLDRWRGIAPPKLLREASRLIDQAKERRM